MRGSREKITVTDVLLTIGVFLIIPMTFVGTAMLRGWVLCKLWLWFAVPAFNVRPLTLIHAIGLSIIVGLFHAHPSPNSQDEDEEEVEQATPDESRDRLIRGTMALVIGPLMALLVGWLWHLLD